MEQSSREVHEHERLLEPGLSPKDVVLEYQQIQQNKLNYEQTLAIGGYLGPAITAAVLKDSFEKDVRDEVHVLDVGAGTGLVGEELMKLGFTTIDGIEPADSMIERAKQKNIYRHIYQMFISKRKSQLPEDSYDAIVTVGTFAENHLPVESLYEFIRLVKPGGIVVICTRLKFLETVSSYKGRLELLMTSLETAGRWKLTRRDLIPNYWFEEEGIVWTFTVL